MSTITIRASCHCKTFDTSFDIPQSAFPLKSAICHCNLCRHSSGHMFGTFAVIPLPYTHTPTTEGLVGYQSSAKLTRWFCRTCGARCWHDDRTAGNEEESWEWEICIGLVDQVEVDGHVRKDILGGLVARVQMWVEDTVDGGASVWINGGSLDGMDRRLVNRQSAVVTDNEIRAFREGANENQSGAKARDKLVAACNCQSVKLSITGKGTEKYEAGLDACQSCRKATGSEITAWVSIPQENIRFANGSKLDLRADCFGRYSTSTGVLRTFCKNCGATISYQKTVRGTIDIAVGLLRETGVRAESWLDWHGSSGSKVACREDTVDEAFINGLDLGIQQ